MVHALMRSNNLLPPNSQVDAPSHMMVERSHKGGRSPKDSEKEEHLSEVAPRRRRIPRSPNRASKHSRCPSPSPDSFLNEEGVREEGTHKRGEGLPLCLLPHPLLQTCKNHPLPLWDHLTRRVLRGSTRDPTRHGSGQGSWKPSKREVRTSLSSPMTGHMDKRTRC